MSLFVKGYNISDVYFGSNKISEIYYGSDMVYGGSHIEPQDIDLSQYTYTIDSQLQVVLTKYIGSGANPTTPNLTEE